MPKNKSYDDRKKILNEMFRSKKNFTLDELIERVSDKLGISISPKTIQNDIRAIKQEALEKDAELKCVNSRYTYEPKNFNLFEVKVDSASIDKIKLAASILKQIPGLDVHEELKEVFEKLEMRVSEVEDEPDIIQFDTRPDYQGAKYLAELLESIKGETVISFDYQPFIHTQSMNIIIHPYLLKEYNNRWFLIGLPEHKRQKKEYEFYVFGLERIKSKIKPESKIEFYRHYAFDASTYYKNIIGVTIPKGAIVENIILRFKIPRAYYVETNPPHSSQKLIKETKTHKLFSYDLIPNRELESVVLSFGSDVNVMSPASFKNRFVKSKMR